MTDEQIKHMVEKFLVWKLPDDFNPDGGISFQRVFNEGTPYESVSSPSGTNLLNYTQAKLMICHILDIVQ
jgi:hypothetical protein